MAVRNFPGLNDRRVQVILEWLCTPIADREPTTKTAVIQLLGIAPADWKAWTNDGEFLAAWETLYRRTVGSPEKKQHVLDELFATATDRTDPRQVPAARAYLEAIDAVKPKQVDVNVTNNATLASLTDEELRRMMAELTASELANRSPDDA
jgi:hypothetical protein